MKNNVKKQTKNKLKNKQTKKAKKVYVYRYKVACLSLLWTHLIDPWCNMLESLEIQRKLRWQEPVSGTHFTIVTIYLHTLVWIFFAKKVILK